MNRLFLILALSLTLAACGGESKQRKSNLTEAETTETTEPAEEETETAEAALEEEAAEEEPAEEEAAEEDEKAEVSKKKKKKSDEPIDLGLEGNGSGNVTVDGGDEGFIAASDINCDEGDNDCLRKAAMKQMGQMKKKCKKTDQNCIKRIISEEAGKVDIAAKQKEFERRKKKKKKK